MDARVAILSSSAAIAPRSTAWHINDDPNSPRAPL